MSGSISIQAQSAPRGFGSAGKKKTVIKFARGFAELHRLLAGWGGSILQPRCFYHSHWFIFLIHPTRKGFTQMQDTKAQGDLDGVFFVKLVIEQSKLGATSELCSLNILGIQFKHQTVLKIHICLRLHNFSWSICFTLVKQSGYCYTVYMHMQRLHWIKNPKSYDKINIF